MRPHLSRLRTRHPDERRGHGDDDPGARTAAGPRPELPAHRCQPLSDRAWARRHRDDQPRLHGGARSGGRRLVRQHRREHAVRRMGDCGTGDFRPTVRRRTPDGRRAVAGHCFARWHCRRHRGAPHLEHRRRPTPRRVRIERGSAGRRRAVSPYSRDRRTVRCRHGNVPRRLRRRWGNQRGDANDGAR